MKRVFKTAFVDTLPVMTGYMVLGFGFGVVMSANGFSPLFAAAMSLFVFAGSMQYAAIPLLTAATPLMTLALTTLMVNARHLFYGVSMLEKYKNTGKRNQNTQKKDQRMMMCPGKDDTCQIQQGSRFRCHSEFWRMRLHLLPVYRS